MEDINMATDNHGFTNEIKNYELVRGLIRHLFQYGDLSKKELAESKLYGSTTNLSYRMKQIQNYLKDDRLRTISIKEGNKTIKTTNIVYDPLTYPVNNLTETFQECTYDINDITFYYCLLQMFSEEDPEDEEIIDEYLLHDAATPFTLPDLIDDFFEVIRQRREYLYKLGQLRLSHDELDSPIFSYETFRRLFNKLKNELGIFIDTAPIDDHVDFPKDQKQFHKSTKTSKEKVKNKDNEYFYRLSDDIFSICDEDPDTLNNLMDMIRFFYNQSDIAVPGWQLANTLHSYMYFKGLVEDFDYIEEPIFQFCDSNALSVIDNDVFWTLLDYIYTKQPITFEYSVGEVKNPEVFPIKIVCERQYGRQYLFAYNYRDKKYYIYRLDRISKIDSLNMSDNDKLNFKQDISTPSDIDEFLSESYKKAFKNAWNIDISNYEAPQSILIHFKDSKARIFHLLQTIKNINREGEIQNETETSFDYLTIVPNTIEIIPWIRSFGSSATVDKEHNPDLYEKLKNNLTEMINRYEPIQ